MLANVHSRPAYMLTHEIIGVIEGASPADLTIRVRPIGSRASFVKKPQELYNRNWLSCFSQEDVAYIGFLQAALYGDRPIPISYFPRKKHRLTTAVMLAAVLFICFSMIANMAALRLASIDLSWIPFIGKLSMQFPAGTVLFPATYALSTILTEVYGYSISRLVIWCGLGANLILVAGLYLVSSLPASSAWDAHNSLNELSYHLFIASYARTFFASALAYFCSEFVNTAMLAKLKVASKGHHAAMRIMASTGLAVSIDSIIFCIIVFVGRLSPSEVVRVMLALIAVKSGYELIFLPAVMAASRYLKARDHVDYYDFDTKFNPFIAQV